MKKFLFWSILCFQSMLFAQHDSPTFIKFTVGKDFTRWYHKEPMELDIYTYTANSGLAFQMVYANEFSPKFGFSLGATYQYLKFERKEECISCGEEADAVSIYRNQFLQIPLTLQYFIRNEQSDIYVLGGFQYQYLLNASNKHILKTGTPKIYSMEESAQRSTVGAHLGVGYKYQLSYATSVGLECMYTQTLGDIYPVNALRNRGISLKFGLFFRLN